MSALEKAITYSNKIGVDECEIIKIIKNITTVRITDSEIVEIKQNFDQNYGIRLIQQKKIASIQTTSNEKISDGIDKGLKRSNQVSFGGGCQTKRNQINQKSKTKRILEGITSKKRISTTRRNI